MESLPTQFQVRGLAPPRGTSSLSSYPTDGSHRTPVSSWSARLPNRKSQGPQPCSLGRREQRELLPVWRWTCVPLLLSPSSQVPVNATVKCLCVVGWWESVVSVWTSLSWALYIYSRVKKHMEIRRLFRTHWCSLITLSNEREKSVPFIKKKKLTPYCTFWYYQ